VSVREGGEGGDGDGRRRRPDAEIVEAGVGLARVGYAGGVETRKGKGRVDGAREVTPRRLGRPRRRR
jgi:hypothetical protein